MITCLVCYVLRTMSSRAHTDLHAICERYSDTRAQGWPMTHCAATPGIMLFYPSSCCSTLIAWTVKRFSSNHWCESGVSRIDCMPGLHCKSRRQSASVDQDVCKLVLNTHGHDSGCIWAASMLPKSVTMPSLTAIITRHGVVWYACISTMWIICSAIRG